VHKSYGNLNCESGVSQKASHQASVESQNSSDLCSELAQVRFIPVGAEISLCSVCNHLLSIAQSVTIVSVCLKILDSL